MSLFLRALLLTGAVILIVCGRCLAVSVWFGDRAYRSLAELDLALETGEISATEYEMLVEVFLSGEAPDSTHYDVHQTDEPSPPLEPAQRRVFGIRYRGTLIQDLNSEYHFRRYDRLAFKRGKWSVELSWEQGDGQDALIRSRSITYRHQSGVLTLGSFRLKLGEGVTIGNSSYSSELRRYRGLAESLLYPLKNRENGVVLTQEFEQLSLTLFGSSLEGEQFFRRAGGGEVSYRDRVGKVGVIGMLQQIGATDGTTREEFYVGPALRLKLAGAELSGESSFSDGDASAHVYAIAGTMNKIRQQVVFFSYSRDFLNPQSGGYAYSDYERQDLEEVGFSFSDKRSGRLGVSVSTRFKPAERVMIQGDLVRWQDRGDGRQAVAGRGLVKVDELSTLLSRVTVRGVWEDFDLTGRERDSRKLISTSFDCRLGERVDLRLYNKWETRYSRSGRKQPFRIRVDIDYQIPMSAGFELGGYYYDPDRRKAGDDYFSIYFAQGFSYEKWVRFTARGRTRYFRESGDWRDWEIRVSADVLY